MLGDRAHPLKAIPVSEETARLLDPARLLKATEEGPEVVGQEASSSGAWVQCPWCGHVWWVSGALINSYTAIVCPVCGHVCLVAF